MHPDSMGAVLSDLEEVFGYRPDVRCQDRAHEYLDAHKVQREFKDTAMLCATKDMVRRAYQLGVYEGAASVRNASRSADEMERRAPYALHGGWRDSLRDYARRIREACGVVA